MKICLLPGDGIGPEIATQAVRVLNALKNIHALPIEIEQGLVGGAAVDAHGTPLPESTLQLCRAADAILLGAVGGPRWEKLDRELRPERGLLDIRQHFKCHANLRPVRLLPELASASSLKPEVVDGLDLMIVRELTGDIYFGQPRGICRSGGERVGYNTMIYAESEIARIARAAFRLAARRRGRLTSVDKMNVLECSQLWRDVVNEVAEEFPGVQLSHMLVDNMAMQLVRDPKQFDVILTGNMFGDILSDEAAMLTGSIGMLPSASLNEAGKGMFEPCHGSAPDIAGRNVANPLGMILSLAMMLEHAFERADIAQSLEKAVRRVLAEGYRTADIAESGTTTIGTAAMGERVVAALLASA